MGLFDSSDTSINIVISAIDQASGVLNTLQGNLQKLKPAFTAMQQLGTIGITAAVGSIVAAAKSYSDYVKSMEEAATKTGTSIGFVSSLGIALDMTGTSVDSLSSAIGIMSQKVQSALTGKSGNAMAEKFAQIGINVATLKGLKPGRSF